MITGCANQLLKAGQLHAGQCTWDYLFVNKLSINVINAVCDKMTGQFSVAFPGSLIIITTDVRLGDFFFAF